MQNGMVLNELSRRAKRSLLPWRQQPGTSFEVRRVPIDCLLMGGESGVSAAKFARLTKDLLRPSRRIADSPHAQLLRAWQRDGDAILEPGKFEQTEYYLNAAQTLDIFGHYFDARSEEQIVLGARRYIDCFRGMDTARLKSQWGQSPATRGIRVRPIQFSNCFQIIDGHHRAATAAVRGEVEVEVEAFRDSVLTPLQRLLMDVLWLHGRKELYQPVDAPELASEWALVRHCSDRFDKMTGFLSSRELTPAGGGSYLDLGCSYGWFVDKMARAGFDAVGVERDPIALEVGQVVYGLSADRCVRADCVRFLTENRRKWDILSCFSILHHFVLGNGRMAAEELIRLLDQATGHVLFLDMGQSHEGWFSESLKGWTTPFIHEWLLKNTTFTNVEQLGPDEDAVPPFEQQYGRTLFACYRE